MEFWGVEVKAGVPFEVKPFPGQIVHISQAALGEPSAKEGKGAKSIPLRLKIDDKELILGSLKPEERTQLSFDLVLERQFVLSHDWKNGSIYFAGYLADDPSSDTACSSDEISSGESDDELEKDSPAPAVDGAPKSASGAADSDDDEDSEDDSDEFSFGESDDELEKDSPDPAVDGAPKSASGAADSDDGDDSEDDSDEDVEPSLGGDSSDSLEEESEEVELPKAKVQQSKKRPSAESAAAPVSAKKAKSKAPAGKKATGKTPPGNKSKQSPKSGGGGGGGHSGKKGKRGGK